MRKTIVVPLFSLNHKNKLFEKKNFNRKKVCSENLNRKKIKTEKKSKVTDKSSVSLSVRR